MLKKLKIFMFLIFLFSFSALCFANSIDVNADGSNIDYGDWQNHNVGDANLYYSSEVKGARVSLIDVEKSLALARYDMCDFSKCSYEKLCKYRILSNLSKPEIIALNKKITRDMNEAYYITPVPFSKYLYPESISFPEFLAKAGSDSKERINVVKEYFKNENNILKIQEAFRDFFASEKEVEKWKNNKLCLLIEPLVGVHTKDEKDNLWVMTCAEYGLLAVNGDASPGERFASNKLSGSVYKALPYGVFKENVGLIKKIKPFSNDTIITHACNCMSEWEEMITTLGCFEVSASSVEPSKQTNKTQTDNIDLVYYTDTDVITSVWLEDTTGNGFPRQSNNPGSGQDGGAKSGVNSDSSKATCTFNINGTNKTHSKIVIPEGGKVLAWVKWRTPSEECSFDIKVTSKSGTEPDTKVLHVFVKNKEKEPPDTYITTDGQLQNLPKIKLENEPDKNYRTSYTWETWRAKWVENWVDNGYWKTVHHSTTHGDGSVDSWDEEVWVPKWEDWGWVEYESSSHSAKLSNCKAEILFADKTPNKNKNYIKSGYGINIKASCETYCSSGDSENFVKNQICDTLYPEFQYKTYNRLLENFVNGNITNFELKKNKYSHYEQRCHYIPPNFPDGKYIVHYKICAGYCPAGELYYEDNISMDVLGSYFDDIHIKAGR